MKNTTLKTILTASALSVVSSYSVLVQAHCIGAQVAAPAVPAQFNPSEIVPDSTSPSQFDAYTVTCPAGTSYLQGRVSRIATGPGNITLHMSKVGGAAQVAPATDTGGDTGMRCDTTADFITDTTGGAANGVTNDNVTGPFRNSVGGVGQYNVVIAKDDVGASGTYNAEMHCFTAANVELGITVQRNINN